MNKAFLKSALTSDSKNYPAMRWVKATRRYLIATNQTWMAVTPNSDRTKKGLISIKSMKKKKGEFPKVKKILQKCEGYTRMFSISKSALIEAIINMKDDELHVYTDLNIPFVSPICIVGQLHKEEVVIMPLDFSAAPTNPAKPIII